MSITGILQSVHTYSGLKELGMSSSVIARKVRQGELTRLLPGVYTTQVHFQQLLRYQQYPYFLGAVYRKNPETVFTHQAAAWLHGLAVVDHRLVDVYCPASSRGRPHGVKKHYSAQEPEVIYLQGLMRATTLSRTLADCCRFLHPSSALVTVESALHQGLCSAEDLAEHFVALKGHGARKAKTVAGLMSPLSESAGESKLKWALHASPLPMPSQQVEVSVDFERFRFDFAYEDERIAIEFDGRVKYQDLETRDDVILRELHREKLLKNAGWEIFRYDWSVVVNRPERIVDDLLAALQRRRGGRRAV